MQRYRWPGYEMQLLGELQRQQNNAQFCDTLLKAEGISVPTHSCILAALSPYLSQKLSASPFPPSGHNRELQLQAVKAETLLKLVSLLYSGEVEVKVGVEQNDVLSAARQFGIAYLVEGQKNGGWEEGEPRKFGFGSCRESNVSRKMQDAQVQTEMGGGRDTDTPMEKRSCASTGTQTVKAGEKTVGSFFTHSDQTKTSTPESASSVAQNLDFFISLHSQNITHDKRFCTTPCPHISSVHSGAQSDGGSTLDRSSDSVTDLTSASSSNVMTFPDDSNSLKPQEDGADQQPSEFGNSIQVLAKEGKGLEDGKTNGKTADNRENTEKPSPSDRDEMLGEEKGNSIEKRLAHANVGMKSLAKMKQMRQIMERETTQISIKVKLRRTTKGEAWEVVNMQDPDETLSVLASLRQDGSNHKRPRTDLTNSEPPSSSVQPGPTHKPENPILQAATTPEPPPHPNAPSDSQLLSRDGFGPNQNGRLESVPLPQPPGPAEECDEQIEKLLEDIMMGLNILPNLERDCKKSNYLQPNHDGAPAICQVPVAEDEQPQCRMHEDSDAGAAGCVYYQDFGTHIGHSSTDTGVQVCCCFTAQNQPRCSSPSSVQPDAVLIQEQCSPQYHSSVTSMQQGDGTSHRDMPLSKGPNCPYPEAPTTTSVIDTALYSSGQKLLTTLTYYPECQEPSSQDNQNILEFLTTADGNEAQSSHSLPCVDDLQLRRCLSPLEPSTSAAKHQPTLDSPTNQNIKLQPQPSLHGRPWLTINPGSLQFPLSAIPHRASSPQDANGSCWPKQWQKHLELNPQNGSASCPVKGVAELKSNLRKKKKKKSLKCKQGDTKGDAAAPKRRKRKHTGPPQEVSSQLACKHVKVSDGTKGQINLSVCSVSLSSNNVLAKEREKAASSSNTANKFVGKPNELSTITESWREIIGGPGDLTTDQTRITTRGFSKKTQENSVLKPMVHQAQIADKGVPKRGRGRPRKTKVEDRPPESSPAVIENKSRYVKGEMQIDSNLPKEDSEKSKAKCKKWMRNRSKVEAALLKKSTSAEADNNNDVIPIGRNLGAPKKPQMVSLKDFQKLIKRQHSKVRKSKEWQDKETDETAGDVESEGKACGGTFEELTKETEMDVAQPQNRDGTQESHVLFSVAVDKNHNQILNKSTAEYGKSPRDDPISSPGKETTLQGDESHPLFSFHVKGEEDAAERKRALESPDKAQEACYPGVSDTTQLIAVKHEDPSHSDTQLTREDRTPGHNLNPQAPGSTSPPLSDTVGFTKSSGCDQEEEEEVEVDVVLYSPDKVPQTRECEKGLANMEMSPEEEEEDGNEIDVTGDEAE